MRVNPPARLVRGFTLVEVLISLVIIAIGLLGVAKMQALALATTANASRRALASIEADSLSAAMHVNRGYWASGVAPSPITVVNGVISDAGLATVVDCSAGAAAPCTPLQIAAYDLQQWAAELTNVLPKPNTATITCSQVIVATPISCSITLTWTENLVSVNQQEAAAATAALAAGTTPTLAQPSYTVYVQP